MEPRTFAMGDIHGAHKALVQCLERCNFNNEIDTLIQLGDVADGWSEVYECVEELLKIKNLIAIKGNHDDWCLTMMLTGKHPSLSQGGQATLDSYLRHSKAGYLYIPETHLNFFKYQHLYYKDDDKRLFVHGGFNRHMELRDHKEPFVFFWDRDLWMSALSYKAMQNGLVMRDPEYVEDYKFKIKELCTEVFIGHTATVSWNQTKPMQAGPIWNLDTGAGFEGNLTIMDVDTHEYWQSDKVQDLYSEEHGRRKTQH